MLTRKTTKNIGDQAENLACEFLKKNNITLLERNFRNRTGEVDIIAKEKNTILFIEVKFRKNNLYGEPFESVTPQKQRKIIQAAQYYLHTNTMFSQNDCRFDVISINNDQITWLKNAFDVPH